MNIVLLRLYRVLSWAKKTLRDCERAVKRMMRLYDFALYYDDNIRRVRRSPSCSCEKEE